jgi:hypothetical protein
MRGSPPVKGEERDLRLVLEDVDDFLEIRRYPLRAFQAVLARSAVGVAEAAAVVTAVGDGDLSEDGEAGEVEVIGRAIQVDEFAVVEATERVEKGLELVEAAWVVPA